MAFDSLVGHDRARSVLAKTLAQGRLPPALLFSGSEGIGKRTLALTVAKALLCERRGAEACGACSTCKRIAAGEEGLPESRARALKAEDVKLLNHFLHPDLILAEPSFENVKPVIKIEQIRALVAEIASRPFEATRRVMIIDDAHFMTPEGANSLLKSLEEPPPTSHIFLVTDSPQTLLPTIRSRCQTLRLSPLPQRQLEVWLIEKLSLAPQEARWRAALAGGSVGVALSFESEEHGKLRDELLGVLESAAAGEAMEALEAAQRLAERDDLLGALTALRSLLRDVAALHLGMEKGRLLNASDAARLGVLARGPIGERAAGLAEAVGESRAALRANANKLLALDMLLDVFAEKTAAR